MDISDSNLQKKGCVILRKSEFEQVYTRVYWDYEFITNEHGYDFNGDLEETWKFSYNPIDGEKFTYVEKNSETGEILSGE